MGATVSVARKVAAFVAASGQPFYVLVESTYEKNCYPHHPHESVCGFGTLDAVMKRVLFRTSGTEGGCLQSRSGHISPETYLGHWREAFRNPVVYRDRDVQIVCRDGSYRRPEDKHAEAINRHLATAGMTLDVTGEISFRLYDHAELLAAMLADKATGLLGWMVLNPPESCADMADAVLAFAPKAPRAITPGRYEIARLGGRDVEATFVLKLGDGEWINTGWASFTMERYIENIVMPAELAFPGCAERLISNFRKEMASCPDVPDEAELKISAGPHGYDQETANSIVQACGKSIGDVLTVSQIRAAKMLRHLTWLDAANIRYNFTLPAPALAAA